MATSHFAAFGVFPAAKLHAHGGLHAAHVAREGGGRQQGAQRAQHGSVPREEAARRQAEHPLREVLDCWPALMTSSARSLLSQARNKAGLHLKAMSSSGAVKKAWMAAG